MLVFRAVIHINASPDRKQGEAFPSRYALFVYAFLQVIGVRNFITFAVITSTNQSIHGCINPFITQNTWYKNKTSMVR